MLTDRHDLLPSQAQIRKATISHIVQSWLRCLFVGEPSQRRSDTTFWSRDNVVPAHGVDGVDTCDAAITTLTATTITDTTISDGGYLSRSTPAGGPASGGNSGSAVEIKRLHRCIKKSEPCEHRFRMELKRCHYRKKCPPSWWIRGLLGKPESFDGGTGWKDWSVVFRSYACACFAPLGLLLERTERSAGPLLNAALTQSEASFSTQLYCMLVMLCQGTSLTRVVNAGAQEGLEA